MKFVRADTSEASGTGYQGNIKITYTELCRLFGKPELPSEDGKVQARWTLKVAGSVIVTIYDYRESVFVRDILLWHVGGKSKDAVQLLQIIIKEQRKELANG